MKRARILETGGCLLAVIPLLFTASAAPADPAHVLTAADGAALDNFGKSLAVSGDLAVVGADGDDDAGDQSGSAYVYHVDPEGFWSQEAKLVASDADAGDLFGNAVAISGNLILIGAFFDEHAGSASGSAYVFRRVFPGVWTEEAKLVGDDTDSQDRFGAAVDLRGDLALIGAPGRDFFAGAAYIFRRVSPGVWTQDAQLLGDAPGAFGGAVALDGHQAVVGALGEDNAGGSSTGAVYVFGRAAPGVWTQEAKLAPDDVQNLDRFGVSVAIHGDFILAGNRCENRETNLCEAAYVFRRDGGNWSQEAKLTAEVPAFHDFGRSVALLGDLAVLGAPADDSLCGGEILCNSGAVHLFRRGGAGEWTRESILTASDPAAGDAFGTSVAFASGSAFVGAPRDDNACPELPICNSGSVSVVPEVFVPTAVRDPQAEREPRLVAGPNPFNASTTITFDVPQAGRVLLRVHDVAGRRVATVADREFMVGTHTVRWNSRSGQDAAMTGGVYFLTLSCGAQTQRVKLALVK